MVRASITFKQVILWIIFLPNTLFVLGLALLSFTVYVNFVSVSENFRLQLARGMAVQVEERLSDQAHVLDFLASVFDDNDLAAATPTVERLLSRPQEGGPTFEAVELLDRSGNALFSWSPGKSSVFRRSNDQDLFARALKSDRVLWSSPFVSKLSGKSTLTVARAVEKGVLLGDLDFGSFTEALRAVSETNGNSLMLMDSQGTYLYPPDVDTELLGKKSEEFVAHLTEIKEGAFSYSARLGDEERLFTAQSLRIPTWFVVVSKPIGQVYGQMTSMVLLLIPILGILLAGAFLLSRLVDKHLLKALETLRLETKKITQGDYSQPINKTRYQDLNEILTDFESMREGIWLREQELRDSEYRFRRMFEDAAVGILHTTFEGKVLDVNLGMAKMLGFADSAEALQHLADVSTSLYVRPEERLAVLQMLKSSPTGKIKINTEFFTKIKEILIVNMYLTRVFDSHSSEFILEAFVEDVTEITKAEREIRLLNQKLEKKVQERTVHLEKALDELKLAQDHMIQSEKMAALGQLISGIAHEINTPLGAIAASNENILALLKKVLDSLPWILQVITLEQRAIFYKMYEKANRGIFMQSSGELRRKRREVHSLLEANGLGEEQEMIDNLAELDLAENTLEYIPLLRDPLGRDSVRMINEMISLEKSCAIIAEASDKASKVINALRTFSHQDEVEKFQRVRINDGLETVLTLFQNRLKYGVEVKADLKDSSEIWGYPDKLNQVWTNLISNALQAMDYKGTLEIRIESDEEIVTVSVGDTGPGIPRNIQGKIFQPFFTTKKAGEGSGLGLDICHRIVEAHQGQIRFESEPGRTVFFVVLKKILWNEMELSQAEV